MVIQNILSKASDIIKVSAHRIAMKSAGSIIGGRYVPQWLSGKAYTLPTSQAEMIARYTSWVYACVNKNAISCAQTTLRLYGGKPNSKVKSRFKTSTVKDLEKARLEKSPTIGRMARKATEIEEIVDHPFLDLMERANDYMNGFDLLEMLYQHLELTGNAYWYIAKDETMGIPMELWPLLPQYVKPVVTTSEMIVGYEFSMDGVNKYFYDAEDIVHFKYPNPRNMIIGMGKLEACVIAADLGTAMNAYEATLFQNNARPDVVIVLPEEAGSPSEPEIAKVKREWRKSHGGKKAGGLGILWGGAKLEQVSLSPREMSYLMGRKASREEVCGIFGVPLSKFTSENVNRANAESGEYTYMKDTVLPMLRRVEQKLTEKLLPMFSDNLFCAFDNPVPEDKEYRLKEKETNLKLKYSSINEEREIDGLEPVEWGKEPVQPEPINQPPVNPIAEVKPPKKAIKKLQPIQQPSDDYSRAYYNKVKIHVENVISDIISNINDYKGVKLNQYDISGWFTIDKWNKELAIQSENFVRATFIHGGREALKQVREDLNFDPITARSDGVMKERTGRLVDINQTLTREVRSLTEQAIIEGRTINQIKSDIINKFGDGFAKERALTIARTETLWAYNRGALEGYRQSGVVEAKEWLTADDERKCQFCREMDGKILALEGQYWQKGDVMLGGDGGLLTFSYEDVQHPPLHPKCRCSLIPVLRDL